jgi:N-acyl-phosphatidylethanolamine-hydrolysing phospholipase D
MSGGTIAAALYTCALTAPGPLGGVPEDAKPKAHHLPDGKGFTNPWDSWRELSIPKVVGAMLT